MGQVIKINKEIWLRDYTDTKRKFEITNWDNVSKIYINVISGNEVMEVVYKDKSIVKIDSSPNRFVDVLHDSYELPLEKIDEFSDFVGSTYDMASIIKGEYFGN